MTSARGVLRLLLCLLAATASCRHEFPNSDTSVTDRGADRPAADRSSPRDLLPSDASQQDGPKHDRPGPDARKDTRPGPDQPVTCAGTPVGGCLANLLCGADGVYHVDCAKCGCMAGGTCTNGECVVSLPPVIDAYTDNGWDASKNPQADLNFGTATTLRLGKTYSTRATIFIDFAVQSIPSIASIQSAQLKLHVAGWGGRAVDAQIALVGQSWDELKITANNAPGTVAGGPVSPTLTIGFGAHSLDVKAHVAQWLKSSSGSVHGLRLEAVDTARPSPAYCTSDGGVPQCGYSVSPASRESPDPAKRPVLEVVYK